VAPGGGSRAQKETAEREFGGFAVVGLFGVQHLIQAGCTRWIAGRAIGYYEPLPEPLSPPVMAVAPVMAKQREFPPELTLLSQKSGVSRKPEPAVADEWATTLPTVKL
jgi:hypothetical protein